MNFEHPLLLLSVLIGVIFIIAGFIMLKFPPKKINSLYGYRTKSSMKNKEQWDFSQKYASIIMIYCGIGLLLIGCLLYFILGDINPIIGMYIGMVLLFISMGIMLYKTEKAIKQQFKSE